MASGFYQLPAPEIRNAQIDFSPVERALDGWKQSQQFNAMLTMRQKADDRATEQHGWQRQTHQQGMADRRSKALGAAAQSLLSMPPEQRSRALQAWRVADKDFDGDLRASGFDPEDVDAWGPMIVARARGVQDPLAIEKTRADIDFTRARANYYSNGGRAAAGSSADERIAERLMSENPDLSYPEALEQARTRPGDRTKRLRLGVDSARYGLTAEELDPAFDRFGVGPNTPSPATRRPGNAMAPPAINRFDFSGSMNQSPAAGSQNILRDAQDAIKRGAPAAAVRQRLRDQYGITNPGF